MLIACIQTVLLPVLPCEGVEPTGEAANFIRMVHGDGVIAIRHSRTVSQKTSVGFNLDRDIPELTWSWREREKGKNQFEYLNTCQLNVF